jgi:cell division protein FtsW (lipid II flippase)
MSTMMNLDDVCAEIWKRLVHCTFFVLLAISVAALRLASLASEPNLNKDIFLEMAIWRLGLLLTFQSAPLLWARFIYKSYKNKLISVPLYQTMILLRIPLTIWAGGCLMTALVLWPVLGA